MWYVHDKRNPRWPQGPFGEKDARRLASDLNAFVRANGGVLTKPFYVVRK